MFIRFMGISVRGAKGALCRHGPQIWQGRLGAYVFVTEKCLLLGFVCEISKIQISFFAHMSFHCVYFFLIYTYRYIYICSVSYIIFRDRYIYMAYIIYHITWHLTNSLRAACCRLASSPSAEVPRCSWQPFQEALPWENLGCSQLRSVNWQVLDCTLNLAAFPRFEMLKEFLLHDEMPLGRILMSICLSPTNPNPILLDRCTLVHP